MSRCKCDDCARSFDRRQEIRHGGVTEEEMPHKRLGKRDTKRWCKGKVGREHELVLTRFHTYWVVYACMKCGKVFWEAGYHWEENS